MTDSDATLNDGGHQARLKALAWEKLLTVIHALADWVEAEDWRRMHNEGSANVPEKRISRMNLDVAAGATNANREVP
ncbi:hypothetical protein [Phenylobacterium sp.]|uniref:hypothetical protein n=1 Tax=Phenylobacterium sp. TaxID=1871053 RepID=UPI0035B1E020